MKSNQLSSQKICLSLALALFLAGQAACNNQKSGGTSTAPGGQTSNVGAVQTGAPSDCKAGQYLDTAGRTKVNLKLQPNLEPGLAVYASMATMPAFQDVIEKDGGLRYVKAIPMGFFYSVGGTLVDKVITESPPNSLKFFEDQGKVYLAVGSNNGLTIFEAGPSSITRVSSDPFLGAVTDIAAKDGQLCVIADGGRAVAKTSMSAGGGAACGQLLYQAPEPPAGEKWALAQHVAATTDGCVVVTRNMPRFQMRLAQLLDWAYSIPKSASHNMDLGKIQDKLLWIKNDGTVKEITPSIGHYDKVFFSDLTTFTDGAIATFTAFRRSNLDAYATSGNGWDLIKSFFEIRAGGLFLVGGEIKKSVELSGLQGPWDLGSGHVLDELPHFSLPYFPAGAVGGSRYALKGMIGLTLADFSNYQDPNQTSLPIEERSGSTDPILGHPGFFTQVQLAGDKLFLGGSSGGYLLGVYDLTNKVVVDGANPAGVYHPVKAKLNLGLIPVAATRNGMILGAGGNNFAYKPADRDFTNLTIFQLKQFFPFIAPADLGNYEPMGLPTVYESPSGEAGDRVAYAHLNKSTNKIVAELLTNKGEKVAVSDAELGISNPDNDQPVLGPAGVSEDLVVVVLNQKNGSDFSWWINAFDIDGNALKNLPFGFPPPAGPGSEKAIKVLGLKQVEAGKYQLYVWGGMVGGDPYLSRITFSKSATNIGFLERKDVALPQSVSVVMAEDKAFAINRNGKVTPIDLAGMTTEADLGNITGNNYVSLCGLVANSIYCSSMDKPISFNLHRFNLDTKEATHYPYHHPFLLSFYSSRLMASYEIDGGGTGLYDLTKAPPQAEVPSAAPGGNITTGGDTGGTGNTGTGGLPSGAKMGGGGGGCSLSTPEASLGLGSLLLMACLVGGTLAARLHRRPLRR
ncbi:MAG: hypothetical protein U1F66_07200 [bacterium]